MNTKHFLPATVKSIDGDEFPHGGFKSTLSMPTLDRDKEIINSGAFDPLPKSIPIFGDHVATIATTVARAIPSYDGSTLVAVGKFAPDDYSQMVRQKVAGGFIDSMSVGFMTPQYDTDDVGVSHVTKAELLEASFVPIPSNRDALVSLAKSYLTTAAKAGRRNSTKDQEAIQAAHDALVSAGAICDQLVGQIEDGDDGKAGEAVLATLAVSRKLAAEAVERMAAGDLEGADLVLAAYRKTIAVLS